MLVKLVVVVVFLLVALGALIVLWQNGNIFSGEGNICQKTGGFLRGCA